MSRPKSNEMDLTVGNPFWSLLKFAVPVILGEIKRLFRDGGAVKVSRSLKEHAMQIQQ